MSQETFTKEDELLIKTIQGTMQPMIQDIGANLIQQGKPVTILAEVLKRLEKLVNMPLPSGISDGK